MNEDREDLRRAINAGTKYWLLVIGQGEGCDYTVDCNLAFKPLIASNVDEATEAAIRMVTNWYSIDTIREAIIVEASLLKILGVQDIKEKLEEEDYQKCKKEEDKRDQEEYERLKKKFGG